MSARILVTYATRAGATAGVADAIAGTLAAGGAAVDVCPMREVKDLAPYNAVVAGSAVQGGHWLPEAMDFLRQHQAALAQKPVAVFLVCMTLGMNGGKYREHVSTWLEPVRAFVKPVSEGLFAGAFDLKHVPSLGDRLKFRASIAMGVWPTGDHRDWEAIRAWAESLCPLLMAKSVPAD